MIFGYRNRDIGGKDPYREMPPLIRPLGFDPFGPSGAQNFDTGLGFGFLSPPPKSSFLAGYSVGWYPRGAQRVQMANFETYYSPMTPKSENMKRWQIVGLVPENFFGELLASNFESHLLYPLSVTKTAQKSGAITPNSACQKSFF